VGMTLGGSTEAGPLSVTTAGARWVDGSQLGPYRLDRLALPRLRHLDSPGG
jgi:hypothetical protein